MSQQRGGGKGSVAALAALYGGRVGPTPTAPDERRVMGHVPNEVENTPPLWQSFHGSELGSVDLVTSEDSSRKGSTGASHVDVVINDIRSHSSGMPQSGHGSFGTQHSATIGSRPHSGGTSHRSQASGKVQNFGDEETSPTEEPQEDEALPLPDPRDEEVVGEIYIQRLLLKCFGGMAYICHRRRHIEGAEFTIAMMAKSRQTFRSLFSWRVTASRSSYVSKTLQSMQLRHEHKAAVGLKMFFRASLAAWAGYARDCRRMVLLGESMNGKYVARSIMRAMDGWSSLVSLRMAGEAVAAHSRMLCKAGAILALDDYRHNVKWRRVVVGVGLERAARSRRVEVLVSWAGWVRHRDHLGITEDRLTRAANTSLVELHMLHWLDWVRISRRGLFVSTVRILRAWCDCAAHQSSVLMIGEMVSAAHERSLIYDAHRCWVRFTSVSISASEMVEVRFSHVLLAWFRECHIQARLRRAHRAVAKRNGASRRAEACRAWRQHTRWIGDLRVLDGGCQAHRECVMSGRALRAWNAVAWRRMVLKRSEGVLRGKMVCMVAGACVERWALAVIASKQKSQMQNQRKYHIARSAASIALAGWYRSALYGKYLRMSEDKVRGWMRFRLKRAVCGCWRTVMRAGVLGKVICVRKATRGWKEGAWASSCDVASVHVASHFGEAKLLKTAMSEWRTDCTEGKRCDEFRERQVAVSAVSGWRAVAKQEARFREGAEVLGSVVCVFEGSKRFLCMVQSWSLRVAGKLARKAAAAPAVARKRADLLAKAVGGWVRWTRKHRRRSSAVDLMSARRSAGVHERVVRAWVGRVRFTEAAEQRVEEGVQARCVASLKDCVEEWQLLRQYKIQLTSAEQYTEEATANYCMQNTLVAWAEHIGYQARLRETETIVGTATNARKISAHIRGWSDWAVVAGLGNLFDLRVGLSQWRRAAAACKHLRWCGEEIASCHAGWTKVCHLRAWRVRAYERRAMCKTTGIVDPREARLRRAALSRMMRAWLGRVHMKAANRDICSALSIKTENKFAVRWLRMWHVKAINSCAQKEGSEAVCIRREMGSMYRCVVGWRARAWQKMSRRSLTASLGAANDAKVLVRAVGVWSKRVALDLKLAQFSDAVVQMHNTSLKLRYFAMMVANRVRSQGKARRWAQAMDHRKRIVAGRIWRPWAGMGAVRLQKVTEAGRRAGEVTADAVYGVWYAWWVSVRCNVRNRTGLVRDALLEWFETVQEEVFHRDALPMADKWYSSKLTLMVLREWFMAMIAQKKYAMILQDRADREWETVVRAVMHAWFAVAVKSEVLWECHDAVQVKMSAGIRGRIFVKWMHCTIRGRFFRENVFLILDHSEARKRLWTLKKWAVAVVLGEQKEAVMDMCAQHLEVRRRRELTQRMHAWQQAVVVRSVGFEKIRLRALLRVRPYLQAWRVHVVRFAMIFAGMDAMAMDQDQRLLRSVYIEWCKVAPFLHLLSLGDTIVSRRTSLAAQRRALTAWRKHLGALIFGYTATLRRHTQHWRRSIVRRMWCEEAAWQHGEPRRQAIKRKCILVLRQVKGRSKYLVEASKVTHKQCDRKTTRKMLALWAAHVGQVWPRRFASYSATSMANVKAMMKAFRAWASLTISRAWKRHVSDRKAAELEEGVASLSLLVWRTLTLAGRVSKRGLLQKVLSGWAFEAEAHATWTAMAAVGQWRAAAAHFEGWWVLSARLALLRGAVSVLLTAYMGRVTLGMFRAWRELAINCQIANFHRNVAPIRRMLRGWYKHAETQVVVEEKVGAVRQDQQRRVCAEGLVEWQEFAWQSRRHRLAKKHMRRAAASVDTVRVRVCVASWRWLSRETARLSNVGLGILIEHNRKLAAGAFSTWLGETSSHLVRVSALRRAADKGLLSSALHDWAMWAARRYYGDAAGGVLGVQQSPPHRNDREYGDRGRVPRVTLPSPPSPSSYDASVMLGPGVSPPGAPHVLFLAESPTERGVRAAAAGAGAAGAAAVLAEVLKKRALRVAAEHRMDQIAAWGEAQQRQAPVLRMRELGVTSVDDIRGYIV